MTKFNTPTLTEEQMALLLSISDAIASTKTMTAMAIDCDLQEYNPNIIRRYYGVIDKLLTSAEKSCKQLVASVPMTPRYNAYVPHEVEMCEEA